VLSFDERHRHCLFVGDDVRARIKAIRADCQAVARSKQRARRVAVPLW
jgi:hypothetical protein